jgi:hypothetical protein
LSTGVPQALPELADVYWRPRASARSLTRRDRLWTLSTVAHTVPFLGAATLLIALKPVTLPVALICVAHAWIIPELYAARGAGVLRGGRPGAAAESEQVAAGMLGDLISHRARELHARTGVVLERGALGAWVVGEAGALLVRPRAKRVHCYCVKATGSDLPPSDRIAHLLLALRTDELGFVTVANLAFAGATWRLRRRLGPPQREALEAALADAKRDH